MAKGKNQISRAKYEEMVARLKYLETTERTENEQAIDEARRQGDLSENEDYKAAKNRQAEINGEINDLKYTLENSEILDESLISTDFVDIGVYVTIRRLNDDFQDEYKIVSTVESNFREKKISDESPVGKAAKNKRVGERFKVNAPSGEFEYEIISIRK